MKKTLSLLLAMLLVLSSMLTLASCGSESGFNDDNKIDNKIYLTLENYEQYLDVNVRYYGENGRWSSLQSKYVYPQIVNSVSVTSTSSFVKFYGCSIKVRVVGQYSYTYSKDYDQTTDETIIVTLSLGGTGDDYKIIDTSKGSDAYDILGLGYEVISVSGYVIVD